MIKSLEIRDNKLYKINNDEDAKTNYLFPLSKLNIFVAPNNSGKSRFIRSILSQDPNGYVYLPNNFDINSMNTSINNIKSEISGYLSSIHFSSENLQGLTSDIPNIVNFTESISDFHNKFDALVAILNRMLNRSDTSQNGVNFQQCAQHILELIAQHKVSLPRKEDLTLKFDRIYIPMLRGLRPLSGSEDIYLKSTVSSYWPNQDSAHFKIVTGLEFNKVVRDHLLGKYSERILIHDYETYLSETFFESRSVSLIPNKSDDGILQIKIGDETQRAIYDLGDGIQSIIIITLPLFLAKGNHTLVFIEEPEHCLHPGAQRKLIHTLAKQNGFENFQYFITTHSNHLLDITQDFENISIFSVTKDFGEEKELEKNVTFLIENLQSGDQKILYDLGTANSSVFLTNSTIWIEGITDRKYIRHYLNLYQNELLKKGKLEKTGILKEDIHFSFVEYGGSNITHWSEDSDDTQSINVKRLTGKMFLIADRDDGIGKIKRREKLRQMLSDRYYPLTVREIENLISPSVLRKTVAKYEKETLDTIPDFVYSDYKSKYLGKYINEILSSSIKRSGGYASDSGTIKNKVDFCEKVIDYTKDWSSLSTDAKNMIEKVFDFIKSQNN